MPDRASSIGAAGAAARRASWIAAALAALLVAAHLPASPARAAAAADPGDDDGFERSIVRIVNFSQRGDWSTPWEVSGVRTSTGSGFVIADGNILTNAHVVSDARMLLLYLHGDPTPHKARAVILGHDCDLALVRPEEPGLLDGIEALDTGGLPALRSTVETYGYPAGGDQISSTRGVVSRIEIHTYSHSGVDRHIAVQTDAAINPGNSGGPVVQGGRVVGVAFQGASDLENTGYAIPVEVIRHFLDDARDGRYDGYPDLAIVDSNLLNPAARRQAGLRDGETGIRVDFITPGGSSDGLLRPGDVLLEVDGHPIANDGSIVDSGLRFDFGLLIDRHQIGDTVPVRILRDAERLTIGIPLRSHPDVTGHANQYDRLPRYYIHGGLVFVPLDNEMLKTYGRDWVSTADRRLIYEHLYRPLIDPPAPGRESVVLLRRLDHSVNINIPWYRNQLVTRVNGREIDGLAGLIKAIETSADRWLVLDLGEPGRFIVLDREAAARANPEILERYGVARDRNP